MNNVGSAKRLWLETSRRNARLVLRIPPETVLRLRMAAKARGMSVSQFIASRLEAEHTALRSSDDITLADVSRLVPQISCRQR